MGVGESGVGLYVGLNVGLDSRSIVVDFVMVGGRDG